MQINDKELKKKVEVRNKHCLNYTCYWPRADPGVFSQGIGYRQRTHNPGWLCGTREAKGCPRTLNLKLKKEVFMKLPAIKGLEVLQQRTPTKMLEQALSLYGLKEVQGEPSNRTIIDMARELDIAYNDDSIPWCGLFMAWVAFKAGKPVPDQPLWALNWAKWGNSSPTPCYGDVMVFERRLPDGKRAGHVALYIAEDKLNYYVIGGNQNDSVCISKIDKKRLVAARNCYKIKPTSAEPIYIPALVLPKTTEQ